MMQKRGTRRWVFTLSILKPDQLPSGGQFVFTFHWTEPERWEGRNFDISL